MRTRISSKLIQSQTEIQIMIIFDFFTTTCGLFERLKAILLWTDVRLSESLFTFQLNLITIIFVNRAYDLIFHLEITVSAKIIFQKSEPRQ